jgi:hypothetical protein
MVWSPGEHPASRASISSTCHLILRGRAVGRLPSHADGGALVAMLTACQRGRAAARHKADLACRQG